MSGNSMKIVVCENCGAKYQLNDDDDIDAFECSSCTGKLRELETIVDEDVSQDSSDSSPSGEVLVYCTKCGLKFQIDEWDNINDFECTSCGGPLDYVSNMDAESSTLESQESQIAQDSYYETVSYVSLMKLMMLTMKTLMNLMKINTMKIPKTMMINTTKIHINLINTMKLLFQI